MSETEAANPDRARLEALEAENLMLRQSVRQADRMRRLWQEAIEELKGTKRQLEVSNAALSSLHAVSLAISQTLDLHELFQHIMGVMESVLDQAKGRPMGIFLVEGDRMRLAASRGASEAFIGAHQALRVGECLCGVAAASGDVIVSTDCRNDPRHTLSYQSGEPHGHVVVPLTAKGRAVGVFYYYLPCAVTVDPRTRETFTNIGRQLGIAIENARLYEQTKDLSLRDPLTGLGNRRLMQLELERNLPNVKRYRRHLALMMIDIDYFKRFNDTYGHPEGDRLLVAVAGILQRETRENDLAVRFGGEEFLVIAPETDLAGAATVAERLRRAIQADTGTTVSIGVTATCLHCHDRAALIKAADQALYEAKAAGRNRVVCHEAGD